MRSGVAGPTGRGGWMAAGLVALVTFAMVACAASPPQAQEPEPAPGPDSGAGGAAAVWTVYISTAYGVSFRHPAGWERDPAYDERLAGPDGFVQVGAVSACGRTAGEVAEEEAGHRLNPYGRDFLIETFTAAGQEGRLILPGSDQPVEMNRQAALVLPYPAPRRIGEDTYCYFILWADEGHVRALAETLRFLEG